MKEKLPIVPHYFCDRCKANSNAELDWIIGRMITCPDCLAALARPGTRTRSGELMLHLFRKYGKTAICMATEKAARRAVRMEDGQVVVLDTQPSR